MHIYKELRTSKVLMNSADAAHGDFFSELNTEIYLERRSKVNKICFYYYSLYSILCYPHFRERSCSDVLYVVHRDSFMCLWDSLSALLNY